MNSAPELAARSSLALAISAENTQFKDPLDTRVGTHRDELRDTTGRHKSGKEGGKGWSSKQKRKKNQGRDDGLRGKVQLNMYENASS